MSILFCDSFDHYDDTAQKWSTAGGSIVFGPDARTGVGCLLVSGLNGPGLGIAANRGIIMGAAVNTQALGFECFNLGLGSQLHLNVNLDGSLSIVDGSGTRGTSAAGIFPANSYQYLEWKVTYTVGNTGVCTVRLNGLSVGGLIDVPWNIDIPGFTDVFLRGPNFGPNANIDDFYLLDTSGTTNNDFLGPIRIYAVVPDANGGTIQFTPSAAVQNFSIVNVIPPNVTQNVAGLAVGITDLYRYTPSAIPVGSQVFGLQHDLTMALDIAGARGVASDVAGHVSTSPSALTSTPTIYHTPYDVNPNTLAAWSLTDFPATQIGQQITS